MLSGRERILALVVLCMAGVWRAAAVFELETATWPAAPYLYGCKYTTWQMLTSRQVKEGQGMAWTKQCDVVGLNTVPE